VAHIPGPPLQSARLTLTSAVSQPNLLLERLSVLYNIGALYSQLATSQSRTTSESLKRACQYFQHSAGTFNLLLTPSSALRLPPGILVEDFKEATLTCLKFLMLAQAQECFWQKAVLGQMKDGLIARLASQVSEFYEQAITAAMNSTNVPADWITHINAKKLHFYAAAQYRKSMDAVSGIGGSNYGEEVARLQEALMTVNKALEKRNFLGRGVKEDLLGLQTILQRDSERAERDNDLIYLCTDLWRRED
jgi:programmed cell death 6-interacting protein